MSQVEIRRIFGKQYPFIIVTPAGELPMTESELESLQEQVEELLFDPGVEIDAAEYLLEDR